MGFADLSRKPIKESDLLDSILCRAGYFAADTRAAVRAVHSPPPRVPGLRILLAEDTPVNQRLVSALLEERGHTVVVANDGREAIAALERESFDLILMDVQMPGMDGFQATAAIRDNERRARARHMPIIAMTAHA